MRKQESETDALQAGEYLVASGLIEPVSIRRQALEQRTWRDKIRQFLSEAFPDLSPDDLEACIVRHVQRRQHPVCSTNRM